MGNSATVGGWILKKLYPMSSYAADTSNRDFLGKPGSHESKMLLKEGVGDVWVEG